ncbi:TonB family protein [Rugamonas sp.]|uniref:TonB family protein n=1 Tax=Rugamonas sp. TaxID=1926287 RepID=UPI0025E99DC6|nr:TonB family protein [Rugamonas sp.]
MSTATMTLQDGYAAENHAAPATAYAPASPMPPLILPGAARAAWLRRPGTAASLALHGAALLAIWAWSSGVVTVPAVPPVVELIRLRPEPKPELTPPQPQPQPVADKPLALAPPRPVAPSVPVPKTVQSSAAQAESYTPPAAPVQAAPVGPVTPVASAPAQPPAPPAATAAPRQIATEGIPTDYVNQVYARINSNADYPREAKMRHQQGRVAYRLTLNPQGALVSFDIESSGVEALDDAAREAIRRAAPFPRLPDLGGSSYLLAGNIVFKIN